MTTEGILCNNDVYMEPVNTGKNNSSETTALNPTPAKGNIKNQEKELAGSKKIPSPSFRLSNKDTTTDNKALGKYPPKYTSTKTTKTYVNSNTTKTYTNKEEIKSKDKGIMGVDMDNSEVSNTEEYSSIIIEH